MEEAAAATKLHVVMIPWLGFGHMIPFMELCKSLTRRGHLVTFISTPRNIDRLLPRIPSHLTHLTNMLKVPPPRVDGLPQDAHSTTDVDPDDVHLLIKLHDEMDNPVSDLLKSQNPTPDWIICDMGVHWAPCVAESLGASCAFFAPFSASTLSFIGPPKALLAQESKPKAPEEMTVQPPWIPIPCKLAYRHHEAARFFRHVGSKINGLSNEYRIATGIQGCELAAIRSCIEFEPEWIPLLGQLYEKPVLPLGFLFPSAEGEYSSSSGGSREETEWLDEQKEGSVLYVAFGSEVKLSREDVTELAFGLELSGVPFLWAYRGDPLLLPIGFQARTKLGQGMVLMGWVQQRKLLAHPSVGAYFTHGGWGSTVEGLCFGRPLIMAPFLADQGLNARVMEEKKVGLELPRDEKDGSFTRDAVAGIVRLVMVEKQGEDIRRNAKEMQKIFADRARDERCVDEFVRRLVINRRRQ